MKKYKHRVRIGLCMALIGVSLCGCSLLPQEEELPAPPVYKAKEVEYEQVQVMRGDLETREEISCTYEASVEEKLSFQIKDLENHHRYMFLWAIRWSPDSCWRNWIPRIWMNRLPSRKKRSVL